MASFQSTMAQDASFFPSRQGILGEGSFNLGDSHLFTGGYHQEIDGVQLAQLDGYLLKFFRGIMFVGFSGVEYESNPY